MKTYTLDEIREIVSKLAAQYGAKRVYLFGSYARQEADAQSDIDLLVIGGANFDPTDVFCIGEELHRATGKPVDVYELREVNAGTDFFRTIFSEGVKIA